MKNREGKQQSPADNVAEALSAVFESTPIQQASAATAGNVSGTASMGIQGIDLNSIRLPSNFGEALAVKRRLTTVPARKPLRTEFFRVHASAGWRLQTMALEVKQDSETYLVAQQVWSTIPELLRPITLHAAVDRRNNVFLIPVPLPGPDGRRNPWHQSLAEVVSTAELSWVRSVANQAVGGYDMYVAEGALPEPEWPDVSFQELVQIAFRDKLITSADHPIINQLLGAS